MLGYEDERMVEVERSALWRGRIEGLRNGMRELSLLVLSPLCTLSMEVLNENGSCPFKTFLTWDLGKARTNHINQRAEIWGRGRDRSLRKLK